MNFALKTPDEIKRYQKIISNKDAILEDAQAKADAFIADAQNKAQELVTQHEIMQKAYAQANETINAANQPGSGDSGFCYTGCQQHPSQRHYLYR